MDNLAAMVNHKLEEGELLTVSIKSEAVSVVDSVIPELLINDDECLYIEGDNMILNILKGKVDEVKFDEFEEEYIVTCKETVYSLS